ncbi:unnamed protein product [Ambrosiozyma monospora]|uniref:Unnamed protein product n=1 Tax=Ambrosiozyma monospora TaxID=43982 RepID=A0A9W6Z2M4_AMBMO|nr:unnamed protein product [Ambrosiozyma monospora]
MNKMSSTNESSTMDGNTTINDTTSQYKPNDKLNALSSQSQSQSQESVSVSANYDVEKFAPQDIDPPTEYNTPNIARTESHTQGTTNLSRILTNADAIERKNSKKDEEGVPIPSMGLDKPYPPQLPDKDAYTVTFDGPDDPMHPHNWPFPRKFMQCLVIGYNTFCVAFGSAVFTASIPVISEIFHVADVVSTLGISLFVFGFATGPIAWAPLSELYGRKPVLVASALLFTVFNFAVAVSDRLESVLICRFFAGCLGAAPMVCVPASFADMFGNKTRGIAVVIFSVAVFMGPMIAPFISFFIVANPSLGWRWTSFIIGIISSPSIILIPLFYTETHHPIILVDKATEIRRRTGNWGIHAAHDEYKVSISEICQNNLSRPIKMLFTEPILLLISIYNAFIYGMLYLFLTAYPIVFQEGYKMAPGVAELPYFGLALGEMIGGAFCVWCEKDYVRKLDLNNGKIVPEDRLPPMIIGAISFPIGLLWFCWTGYYHNSIHWIVPTISGLFTGFGLMGIFIPSMNYIVDSYLLFAASAMAGNTFLRSGFGGTFPLFAGFMFKSMHTNWAGLLLGVFAIVLILCPIGFIKFGKRLRQKSNYAFDLN